MWSQRYHTNSPHKMDGLQKFKDALDIGQTTMNNIPYGTRPMITQKDATIGYITRYFIQFLSNKTVIEVDKTQFDKFAMLSSYKGLFFKWYINGKIEDTSSEKGVRSKNTATLDYYKTLMPELNVIIRNPLQYYVGLDTPAES